MSESFKFSREPSTLVKPFLNVNGLIRRLDSSDNLPLTFSESEISDAEIYLKTRNYYSISIYKKQLPYDNVHNSFSFTDLIQLVHFDEFLRQIIGQFTFRIEEMMKTTVVKSACINYKGPYQKGECYLDESIYLDSNKYNEVLESLEKTVEENQTSLTIKHHMNNKQSRIPLWVLAEEMTFGQISFFFSALNNDIKKNWAYYGFLSRHHDLKKIKGEEISARLFSWFSAAWFLRNLCAHNQRIYGKLLISGNPQIYSNDIQKMKRYGKKKNDNRDLFAYLISIKNILIFDSPTTHQRWNDFLDILEERINHDSKVVRLSKIGFVSDWKNLLKINFDQGLKQLF